MARPKKNQMTEEEVANATPEVVGINTENVSTEPTGLQAILPEADRLEIGRYFCVINTSNQASRIQQEITHQRDLEMWGIHQYNDNPSRNSYARSFYFKSRDNAVKALEHTNKLLD
jgi:hypothetical protein